MLCFTLPGTQPAEHCITSGAQMLRTCTATDSESVCSIYIRICNSRVELTRVPCWGADGKGSRPSVSSGNHWGSTVADAHRSSGRRR